MTLDDNVRKRLAGASRPIRRTVGYLGSGSRQRRAQRYDALGIPMPPSSMSLAAQVGIDEMALATFSLLRPSPDDEVLERMLREAHEALDLFERSGWLDEPAAYLTPPPPPVAHEIRPLDGTQSAIEQLTFESGWQPRPSEPGAERWSSYAANRTAYAHVLRHQSGPRPWIVCLHGTGMGRLRADMRVHGVRHLYHDLGLNVVLPVLPLHGPRREGRGSSARLPTIDVLDDVHGLAQAASDVRQVLAWVRTQDPTGVALVGLSLGGYVAALVAGLEPPLDALIACIPAADLPRVIERHQPRSVRNHPLVADLGRQSAQLHRAVSPLGVIPATPVARRFVLAGSADRLLDPVEQAGALWEHWGRPEICWLPTGHVGNIVRREGEEFIEASLRSADLI